MGATSLTYSDKLSDQHRQMALLVAQGYANRDIALSMGIAEGSVKNLKRSPIFQMLVNEMLAEIHVDARVVQRRLIQVSEHAIDFVDDVLAHGPHDDPRVLKIQAETALSVLSRAGLGETVNVNSHSESRSIHAMLTADELDEVRQRVNRNNQ